MDLECWVNGRNNVTVEGAPALMFGAHLTPIAVHWIVLDKTLNHLYIDQGLQPCRNARIRRIQVLNHGLRSDGLPLGL